MYQRIGSAAYKANLNNTIKLDNYFNNPHKKFKSIHIAGTNGKGSVSNMLASIFQEAGYKVGLYTSPHLLDFRERIRINGEMIPEIEVINFIDKNNDIIDNIKPSFFEMTVAMAFNYFSEQKVDFAIIETGLGGRLDSTNIINPLLSVITNISLDHVAFLGNTLKEIAIEKAGIIKENVPVVIGRSQNETKEIFLAKAQQKSADILFADTRFDVFRKNNEYSVHNLNDNNIYNIKLDLFGDYQKENLLTVLTAFEILNKQKYISISDKTITDGLKKITKNTNFAGRWQIIKKTPLTICDTGHNLDGVKSIVTQINKQKFNNLHFVLGTVNDKNIDEILKLLPKNAKYYFTNANISRALNRNILAKKAISYNLNGETYETVKIAYFSALKNATANDMIFIGGSTFIVAEVLDLL